MQFKTFLVTLVFLAPAILFAQDNGSPVVDSAPTTGPSWIEGMWTQIQPHLSNQIVTVAIGAITLVFAYVSALLNKRVARLSADKSALTEDKEELETANTALSERLADPLLRRIPEFETRALNALFVGIGGSGKTSLIHAVSGSPDAKPSVATAENNLYSIAHEVNYESASDASARRLVRLFMSDHVGQNFNSIGQTDFFINPDLQQLPKCMVVVVDVQAPASMHADMQTTLPEIEARTREHVEAFNDQIVQMLMGGLDRDSSIVLFINKVDVIPGYTSTMRQEVQGWFQPIIDRLSRARGIEFTIIFGSANTGMGINACTVQPNGYVLPNLNATLLTASKKVAG